MKKIMWSLGVLMFASLSTPAYAGDNNPNSFGLEMSCGGEIVHIAVPAITSSASHTDGEQHR